MGLRAPENTTDLIHCLGDCRNFRLLLQNKLIAEAEKLNAEAGKMSLEIFWYPVVIAIGMFGAAATVTALIIKFL